MAPPRAGRPSPARVFESGLPGRQCSTEPLPPPPAAPAGSGDRGRRQRDGDLVVAGADRGDANVGDKTSALLRGGRDGELGLIVAPAAGYKAAHEKQQRASAEQRPAVATSLARRVR